MGLQNRLSRAEPWKRSRFRRTSESRGVEGGHLSGRCWPTSGIVGPVCSLSLVTQFSVNSVSDVASQIFDLRVPGAIGVCIGLPSHEMKESRSRVEFLRVDAARGWFLGRIHMRSVEAVRSTEPESLRSDANQEQRPDAQILTLGIH